MTTSDEQLITNLVHDYARGYDERDLDVMGACFHPDGVFSWEIKNGPAGGPFEGAAAIVESNAATLAAQNDTRRHVMTNVTIVGNGDKRSVTSYLTLFAHQDGRLVALTTGVYTDEVVKTDGAWRFSRRHLLCDLPF